MIEVTALSKSFGPIRALAGVSFHAKDGEVTGLLGPNGAGKTTLLRILSTLLRPDSGSATVAGLSLLENPERVRALLGVVPHAHGLYGRLSAREHVRYFGRLHGLGGKDLERRIERLAEELEMQDILDRRAEGFSQGQAVKVAIARALVHDPHHILLDEPTAGLDVMSTRAMRAFIRRLRSSGRCILLSSHLMHEVAELCDRIVVIARGRVVAWGTPAEIQEQTGEKDLEDAFVALVGTEEAPPT